MASTAMVRRNGFWLVVSLILCLVSALGASLVQTAGGTVTVKTMKWETASGQAISALLYKPVDATVEDPRPAVVVSHGWYNNKEMQDANYVELARRGFVVVSMDMYGHGNSDYLARGTDLDRATGMTDVVELVATWPYVDASRIGVSGHSNGARASNLAVGLDNDRDDPLIASVLLVDNDGIYTDEDTGDYINYYGDRDVGIFADQYDEFFFRSYDENGNALTPPREYVGTDNAQSFLHFGADPGTVGDQRAADQVYTDTIEGTEAMRVIYNPAQNHPWGPFSATEAHDLVSFFDQSLTAPSPRDASSQVWQIKEGFNALGLVGFGMFLIAFTRALLGTRAFAGLKNTRDMTVQPASRATRAWFWGGLAVAAVFAAWSYVAISRWDSYMALGDIVPQAPPFFVGTWAAVNGIFALILITLAYWLTGRKEGLDLKAAGVFAGWKKFWHGLSLGAIVSIAAFGIVFVLAWVFTTDFRLWVLAIKPFDVDKLWMSLAYLPFFFVYFVATSVSINAFNRFSLAHKEWVNTIILAILNTIGPLFLVVLQYSVFFTTGEMVPWIGGIFGIWLYPFLVILPVATIITRKIYRATNNPYIGGFINAAVVTVISVTNTLTYTG